MMTLPKFGASKLVWTWILLTLVASIVALLDGGWLASWTSLSPSHIWHGQVWRLVTWIFVQTWPPSLIFACVSIYKFGGELAYRWGDRRLRNFVAALVLVGSIAATLGALVSDNAWLMQRHSGGVIGDILVIAWARQFPTARVQLYMGLLTLSGQRLINFTLAVTCLFALALGPFVCAPELACCFLAAFMPREWLERLGRSR